MMESTDNDSLPTQLTRFEASLPGDATIELEIEDVPFTARLPDKYEQCRGIYSWPGARLLGSYLLSEAGRLVLRGKTVVELGCGVGLLGPVAALAGAKEVTLTDYDVFSLGLAKQNVQRNTPAVEKSRAGKIIDTVSVEELDWHKWGRDGHNLDGRAFDVVLISDCVYEPSIRESLKQVLLELAERNPAVVILMAGPFRSNGHDTAKVQQAWLTSLAGIRPERASGAEDKCPRHRCTALDISNRRGRSRSPVRGWHFAFEPMDVHCRVGSEAHTFHGSAVGTEQGQPLRIFEPHMLDGLDPPLQLFRLWRTAQ